MNFDRTGALGSVSKLEGCFTRGREYRWDVFRPFVEGAPRGSRALDFGCGSLVETHYLASRHLSVTAVDLDLKTIAEFKKRHDWTGLPEPKLRDTPLAELARESTRYDIITAFDVLEHLPPEQLPATLAAMRSLLTPNGVMLVTVPNKRSASEMYQKVLRRLIEGSGRRMDPGVPHLTVRTPAEWRRTFTDAHFEIAAWDMAIGPLVNTWHVAVTAPLHIGMMGLQLLGVLSRERRHRWVMNLERAAIRPWRDALNAIDETARPLTRGFFTWNLVVLRPGAASPGRPPRTA